MSKTAGVFFIESKNDMKTDIPSSMMTTQDTNVVQPFLSKVNWREFVCGWGAAFINITVTYPVNKIIFRQVRHKF